MALSLQPGKTLSIPCRACGRGTIPFTVTEGTHALICPQCEAETEVRVYRDGEEWRIATGNDQPVRSPEPPPPESPVLKARLTPRKEKKMAKRKLTPEQRKKLKKDMKRKVSAGRAPSEILKEASQKYGIAGESARWYLKPLLKGSKKSRRKGKSGKPARAQRSKSARGKKNKRSAKTASVRSAVRRVSKAPYSLADLSKSFSTGQLKRALAASELRPKLNTIVERERRILGRQRELGRELRTLTVTRQKLELRIRRLAR